MWLRHESFMIAYSVPLHKQDLPAAQTQRFAGKKVSLRRRQQADTPNHCSIWHKSSKILLWYASNCNALRAATAGLSYCLQFLRLRSGSYCVLHATSFITSFVPLHYTSFAAIHLLQGMSCIPSTLSNTCSHIPFRKPTLQYSLGSIPLHYIIHSLQ
jgi:hypothetical protein